MVGSSIADRLQIVRERISTACDRAGRDPASVRLIAVTKQQSVDKIEAAVAAGQLRFGENYVQEAAEKLKLDARAEWHFIGALQSNKAKNVVGAFTLIHTIDRDS